MLDERYGGLLNQRSPFYIQNLTTYLFVLPQTKLDFKPSPKSMPLGQLAMMVGTMPAWFLTMIGKDTFEMSEFVQPPKPAEHCPSRVLGRVRG